MVRGGVTVEEKEGLLQGGGVTGGVMAGEERG